MSFNRLLGGNIVAKGPTFVNQKYEQAKLKEFAVYMVNRINENL